MREERVSKRIQNHTVLILYRRSDPLLSPASTVSMQNRTLPVNHGAHVAWTNFTIKNIQVKVLVQPGEHSNDALPLTFSYSVL